MKTSKQAKVLRYNAVFEPCKEGGFTVTVPKLPGLVTEGDTYEEALNNVNDAITGYLKLLKESGESIPDHDAQSFTTPISIRATESGFATC